MMASGQRGNILFLILLAVVLFAALSYAVTSSTQGGGRNASKESIQSQIALLQNNGQAMRTALMRMTTVGGYQPWQIDYSKSNFSSSNANATCTSTSCQLHHPDGGGMSGLVLPVEMRGDPSLCAYPAAQSGSYTFRNVSVKGIGLDDRRDLMLNYGGIHKTLCMSINDQYGVKNPGNNPPVDNYTTPPSYSGTLTQEVDLNSAPELGESAEGIDGKPMFCTITATGSCYFLWMTLIER